MDETYSLSTRDQPFGLPRISRYFAELSSQSMVAVEGPAHVVRHANAAFYALAGVTRADVIGRPFAEAVPEGRANGCVGLLDRVFHTGRSECLAEQSHGAANPVFWSYAVWAIQGGAGGDFAGGGDEGPIGVMIQVSDSTETARFRAQAVEMNQALLVAAIRQEELAEEAAAMSARLRAAVQEKEYFIAVLSHELRTPLTPVLVAASLLEQDPRLDPEARAMMAMIGRNVTLEARLIDDLLDMTRLERGKVELDRGPVDLRVVVERAVEACAADVAAGKLTLAVDAGGAALIVHGDGGRLGQVVTNLLRNAIKFTPPGGRVGVRCHCDVDSCAVEVSDDGAGIDPEFLPRAFAAFEQDKTQLRKAGLGLGLAICKTIVELHGGAITARSAGKGLGATFVIRLPRVIGVAAEPLPAPAPDATPALRPVRPLRILLVEDHADTAQMMRWLLKADGHAVEWAADVAAGLALAATHQFDLLLSDLGLPDGTGVELMRTLRGRGWTAPGIVLSGYGQDQDVQRSLAAGFLTHLVKPLSPRRLRAAIAAATDAPAAASDGEADDGRRP